MTYTGKESLERADICLLKTDSLCCTPGNNTTWQLYSHEKKIKYENKQKPSNNEYVDSIIIPLIPRGENKIL